MENIGNLSGIDPFMNSLDNYLVQSEGGESHEVSREKGGEDQSPNVGIQCAKLEDGLPGRRIRRLIADRREAERLDILDVEDSSNGLHAPVADVGSKEIGQSISCVPIPSCDKARTEFIRGSSVLPIQESVEKAHIDRTRASTNSEYLSYD